MEIAENFEIHWNENVIFKFCIFSANKYHKVFFFNTIPISFSASVFSRQIFLLNIPKIAQKLHQTKLLYITSQTNTVLKNKGEEGGVFEIV